MTRDSDDPLFKETIKTALEELAAQYRPIEPNIKVEVSDLAPVPGWALSPLHSAALLNFLRAIPTGVIAMSQDLAGLVETSNNLGKVDSTAGSVDIICNSGSSIGGSLDDVTASLVSLAALARASAIPGPSYPGWKPDPNSPTLNMLKATYKKVFGKDAVVSAVHAGLECGVFNSRFPNLDIVSFGPTIVGAHSTQERVHIGSVSKCYNLLKAAVIDLAS